MPNDPNTNPKVDGNAGGGADDNQTKATALLSQSPWAPSSADR